MLHHLCRAAKANPTIQLHTLRRLVHTSSTSHLKCNNNSQYSREDDWRDDHWRKQDRRDDGWRSDTWDKYSSGLSVVAGLAGVVAVHGLASALCDAQQQPQSHVQGAQGGKDVVGVEGSAEVTEKNTEVTEGNSERQQRLDEAVREARKLLKRRMQEAGAPGLTVAVSVDGMTVWADGMGFADLENGVRCRPQTVMRIASISKSLTMTAVARLVEDGKLDLDSPVQKYVPNFPAKQYEGEEVIITTRHLLSHQSGIRHYKLKDPNKKKGNKQEQTPNKKQDEKEKPETPDEKKEPEVSIEEKAKEGDENQNNKPDGKTIVQNKSSQLENLLGKKASKKRKKKEEESEFDMEEYYIKENFESVEEALKLFQDDELFFKPGSGFLYTTHGWTLVSAVVEGAAATPFTKVATQLFHDLAMDDTCLDKHSPIIYNRARYYVRDGDGRLQNAPYVDNSYKWAGGGFLSTVHDLNKFGNAMLYASQHTGDAGLPGYLKASTMKEVWSPVHGTNMGWDRDGNYGLGWGAVEDSAKHGCCRTTRRYVSHTGGAVGASSVLLILPRGNTAGCNADGENSAPKGVVVSVISNMQGVGLNKVALKIAKLFESL